MRTLLYRSLIIFIFLLPLLLILSPHTAAGIVQAIIPQGVPPSLFQGTATSTTKFQGSSGSPVSGNCGKFDATGLLIDAGSPCGSANAGGIIIYSGPSLTLTGTLYFPASGGGASSTTETNVDVEASSPATLANFYVQLNAALGVGNSAVFTWRKNASSQSLTCTISGAVATSCNDTTHTFNVAAGDLIDMQVVTTGTIALVTLVTDTQFGTTGTSGQVNSGTAGQFGYYAATGSAVSGAAGMTANGVVLYEGTSTPKSTAAGTAGQALTSNGAGSDPTYQNVAAAAQTLPTRVQGTVYQNTGNTMRWVGVSLKCGGANTFVFRTDGSNPPTTNIWVQTLTVSTAFGSAFFGVLPGNFYKLQANDGVVSDCTATLNTWVEQQ